MEIIQNEIGRHLVHNNQAFDLPALALSATVRLYNTPVGLWVGVHEIGKPMPIYPGRGPVELLGELDLDPDAAMVLEAVKAERLRYVIEKSEAAAASIVEQFSHNERLSWPKQEAEAKALLGDTEAQAPLLRGIANARGIPLETLRDKVLEKVISFEVISAQIIGYQQALEDRIKSAQTVEDVQAVEW